MSGTIITNTITFFAEQKAAAAIAVKNARDDAEWFYNVERLPRGWVIAVYDEDMERLGYL